MIRTIVLIIILSSALHLSAQETSKPASYKLGIKTAVNLSTLLGSEFENPTPRFGYTAGAYVYTAINKKWQFQTELLANFKGSNFKNDLEDYTKISTFCIDMPVMLGYRLNEGRNAVLFGPQFSYLSLSSMYIGSNAKAYINDIGLDPFGLDACVMYQVNGKVVGFQMGVKLGLLNINNGVNFENINPPTGKGGTIKPFSFEIGMLF